MSDRLRKYVAEAVGIFVVVLCGCGSYIFGVELGAVGVALAFGLSLTAMTTIFFPVSGGQFNPAVSLALFIKGKLTTYDFLGCLAGQLVGAFSAAGLLLLLCDADSGLGANEIMYLSAQSTVIVEVLLSFIFVTVYLEVASQPKLQSLSGLLIGLTFTALYIFGSYFSGPSLNPFRSLSTALLAGDVYLTDAWVFVISPLIGGGLAGLAQPWLCNEPADAAVGIGGRSN